MSFRGSALNPAGELTTDPLNWLRSGTIDACGVSELGAFGTSIVNNSPNNLSLPYQFLCMAPLLGVVVTVLAARQMSTRSDGYRRCLVANDSHEDTHTCRIADVPCQRTLTRSKQASRAWAVLVSCDVQQTTATGVLRVSMSILGQLTPARNNRASSADIFFDPNCSQYRDPTLGISYNMRKSLEFVFFHPKSYLVERWLNCWTRDARILMLTRKILPWLVQINCNLYKIGGGRNFRWCQL